MDLYNEENIKIYNIYSEELLNKTDFNNNCLWNNKFLFIECEDNKGIIIKK